VIMYARLYLGVRDEEGTLKSTNVEDSPTACTPDIDNGTSLAEPAHDLRWAVGDMAALRNRPKISATSSESAYVTHTPEREDEWRIIGIGDEGAALTCARVSWYVTICWSTRVDRPKSVNLAIGGQ
jgi:hypothetical protein